MFLKEPSRFTKGVESIPLDIPVSPFACVIGFPKSGKSTLCQKIQERTGAVHLQINEVIESFVDQDSFQCAKLREKMKQDGRVIDDSTIITLILKRIQAPDCQKYGFILEDFPRTKAQAILMARNGLKP
jgi:adenylate kinase family enzyme